MRKLLLVLASLLLLASPAFAAPFLAWDAVTTGTDGQPLGAGLEVTAYKVYSCGTSVPACATTPKTLVGTVLAPTTQFDIAGQAVPLVYVATAVNKVGESGYSSSLKVVPPDIPKNLRLP